jgi:S1-C subfamily serine protease
MSVVMRNRIRALCAAAAVAVAAIVAATAGVQPASAATASEKLKRAGKLDQPSVVMILVQASAYLNDNGDGKTYGAKQGVPFKTGGWGTGFFVSSDGYIVTAAHVGAWTQDEIKNKLVEQYLYNDSVNYLKCDRNNNCPAVMDQYRRSYRLRTSLADLKVNARVFTQDMNPAQDTGLPAEVKVSSPWGQRDTAVLKINMQNAPVLKIGDAQKVQVQDSVSIIGYPGGGSVGEGGAVSQQSVFVPTVTTGTITAKKQGSTETGIAPGVPIFQTDATIEHGNSGGPAINEDGQVIGLVSFGPTSTTNFLMTASDINDLMRQAGANNSQGQIDSLWRQGLGYMDQKRFVKAKATFEQCVALNKTQVGCTEQARLAASQLGQDQESKYTSTGPGAGTLIGILLGLLVLGGLAVAGVMFIMRRNAARPVPSTVYAPTGAVNSAAPPLIEASQQPQAPPQYASPPAEPPAPATPAQYAPPPSEPLVTPAPQPQPPPTAPEPVVAGPKFCSNCGTALEGRAMCANCGQRVA